MLTHGAPWRSPELCGAQGGLRASLDIDIWYQNSKLPWTVWAGLW